MAKSFFGGNRKGANKQLGVNVGVIVQHLMKDTNCGFVDKTEFNYFWAAMQDGQQDCNVFLHLLITNLLGYLTKNKKIPFSPQVLLNTINFLTLRHELAQSKQVTDILKKWRKKRESYDDPTVPSTKDVMNVLYKRYVDGESALGNLVIQCYQFYNHTEVERISDYYENPTIVDVICNKTNGRKDMGSRSGDKVCVWSYLKKLVSQDEKHFKEIFSETLGLFMSIKGQILLSPKLAEISLLTLIFMLRQLVSYNRVPGEEFIERAIVPLKQFYLWPIPYGSQARDLLLLLKKERVAPGFGLIQKIWKECHLPEIVLLNEDEDSGGGGGVGGSSVNEEETFRPLYYLFDIHDRNAILTSNVMRIDTQTDWGTDYQVHTGVSPRTCALLMLNLISYDCGIDSKRSLENSLKLLNEHEIILFYKQVIDIFTKSSETNDISLAKKSRKEGLSEIQAQIIEHSKNKIQDNLNESEDDLVDLTDIPEDYSISLPILHHTGIACDLTREQFPTQGQMASAEVTYPVNNVLEKIRNILTQLSKLASEKDPITLRFVIAGGNNILNATITAYASLRRHGSSLISKFNLEFLVIPYSINNFADWLARQDPWYFRHIYLPLQSRLYISPSLQPDTKPKLSSSGKLHTVGKFYRDMAESYAHEADEIVPLMLWECHCWSDKPFTQTPKQLIPFCQRVVLGYQAEFVGQQLLYTQGDDDDYEEDDDDDTINDNNINSDNDNNENNDNDNNDRDEHKESITDTNGTVANGDIANSEQRTSEINGDTVETNGGGLDSTDNVMESTTDINGGNETDNNNNNDDGYESTNEVGGMAMASGAVVETHASYNNNIDIDYKSPPTYDINNNMLDDNTNGIDMEAETYVFQPFPLDVEWQSVDMIGKPNNFILQKQQYLTSLTISSCPRYGDKGFPASPCNEGVAQMYAELSDASRKRKFQEYGLFKNEPSQHVRTATITTSDMDNKFWIMVDDRTYGPFARIKIQPMVDPMTKKQVFIPIKTYFPVDNF